MFVNKLDNKFNECLPKMKVTQDDSLSFSFFI